MSRGHFRGLVSVAIPVRDHFRMASGGRFNMSIPRAYIKASVALALTSVALFTTSAFGQSPAARKQHGRYCGTQTRQCGEQSRG